MNIQIRYFASVREALGTEAESLRVPDGVGTVGELRTWLRQRGGAWAEQLADGRPVRMAVDHQMTDADATIHDGAEVAFFPPVTGG